jgi:hypothetical protein
MAKKKFLITFEADESVAEDKFIAFLTRDVTARWAQITNFKVSRGKKRFFLF